MRVFLIVIVMAICTIVASGEDAQKKNIVPIKDNLNGIWGVAFGYPLSSTNSAYKDVQQSRKNSTSGKADGNYYFEPRNAFSIIERTKRRQIGVYYLSITGQRDIAYGAYVEISDSEADEEQRESIVTAFKKKYGMFELAPEDSYSSNKYVILQSESNPSRSITISSSSSRLVIKYYCADIEEKYKNDYPKAHVVGL